MDFSLTKDQTFFRKHMGLPKRILRKGFSRTAGFLVGGGIPEIMKIIIVRNTTRNQHFGIKDKEEI